MSSYRPWLAVEFMGLFGLTPLLLLNRVVPINVAFLLLWGVAAVLLLALLIDERFDRRELVHLEGLKRFLPGILVRFVCGAACIGVLVLVLTPERLFSFPRENPRFWAIVMVFYPVLSVVPQGLVYRTFILHRYQALVPGLPGRIMMSAAAFAAVHLVLSNAVAPLLTLLGGLMFTWTYARSRSLLISCIEHALYGCFIFTIGWGHFFYLGAVRA